MIVCCCSIPRLIISFALDVSYCCSRFKNELYMIVCCYSIPRLIISFALNGSTSYCRSHLKNELYMYVWLFCCGSIRRLIALEEYSHLLRFLFVLASSLACFFVYTALGEICGRSFFRTRNHTLHSPLCVFVLAA